jgi:hypothetical protein
VSIVAEKDAKTVVVPALAPVLVENSSEVAVSTGGDEPGMRRTWGLVALAAGGVGLGIGTVFALKAHSKRVDADGAPDNAAAAPLYDDARSSLTVSRIALGLGVIAAVTGAVLVITAPNSSSGSETSSALRLSPSLGPGSSGFILTGGF